MVLPWWAPVLWIACAIACGFLAPLKGRPSGSWFLAGLVFSVVALVALAFVERQEPDTRVVPAVDAATAAYRASGSRVCVNCGKTVRADRERYCNHCGRLWATVVRG